MTNEELRVWREQHKMSQEELACELGVHFDTYGKRERKPGVVKYAWVLALKEIGTRYGKYTHVVIRLDGTVEEMAGHAMDKYTTELVLKMSTRRVQIWREFDELEIRKRLSADILAQRMAEYEKLRGE